MNISYAHNNFIEAFLLSLLYRFMYSFRKVIIACLFLLPSFSSAYATDVLDVVTGLKTLPFMNNRPSGPIVVAVLYDPANAVSKADAEIIKRTIEDKISDTEYFKASAKLVSISELAALSNTNIAFLAKDISPHDFDAISNMAAINHILTVSTDLGCVRANKCILGIATAPRVEIYFSPVAAQASGISFSSTFNMLVEKL